MPNYRVLEKIFGTNERGWKRIMKKIARGVHDLFS